jgi:hypothetical protein
MIVRLGVVAVTLMVLSACGGDGGGGDDERGDAQAACYAFVDDFCDAIVNECGLMDSVVACENDVRSAGLECECVEQIGGDAAACDQDLPDVTCADLEAGVLPSTCDGVFLTGSDC